MWYLHIRSFSPWTFIFPSIEDFLSLGGAVMDDVATGVADETREINNLLPRHAFPRHDGAFRRTLYEKPTLMALVVNGPGEHSQLGNTGELANQVRHETPVANSTGACWSSSMPQLKQTRLLLDAGGASSRQPEERQAFRCGGGHTVRVGHGTQQRQIQYTCFALGYKVVQVISVPLSGITMYAICFPD
ncbi:hypothetical protein LX32DRAFT_333918 [Colletotrichum zoysiae]|uniref:Uncharacterized protein n=1 Tax=Colletotrichum zoysiae TaxID=1216348 RepID=A0AAD9M154_9PEZI|nr:hypothetical protein LX32DRAFT_333918 [Colletotrichum zoysiae]